MSWLSTLRSKWRQHDEQLAERAHRDGDTVSETNLVPGLTVGGQVEKALQSDDALEHEEPT